MKKEKIIAFLLATCMLLPVKGSSKKMPPSTDAILDELSEIRFPRDYQDYFVQKDIIAQKISPNNISCPKKESASRTKEIQRLALIIESNSLNYIYKATSYQLLSELFGPELLIRCLQEIFLTATNNVSEDFCLLESLVIVISYEENPNMALYEYKENRITIFYNSIINSLETAEKEHISNKVSHVLKHELQHVRQRKCNHRLNGDDYLGISFSSYISFLAEASAESSLYNLDLDETSFSQSPYLYERQQENMLLLLGITNPSLETYYNAIFDADYEKLYCFWSAHNLEKIAELYKILYLMDTAKGRTKLAIDLSGNSAHWLDTAFPSLGNLEEKISFDYEIAIFKLALKNLALNVSSRRDISFLEHILLFRVIKNTLATAKSSKEISLNSLAMITEIDRQYKEYLSLHYEVPIGEISEKEAEIFCFFEKTFETKILPKYPVLKSIFNAELVEYDDFIAENSQKLFLLKIK